MGPLGLLASLAQPLDDPPTPLDKVDVAWSALAPVLVLIGGALVLLVAAALLKPRFKGGYAAFTVLTALVAGGFCVPLWQRVQDADRGPFSTLAQAVGVDGFSIFATFVLCGSVVLAALLMDGWLRREEMEGAEPYVLLLLSASGGLMMASANDLIVMFLGLEILSLAVYVLAAMHLRKITSQEAGVKYFVLGAFSSAFFLYGIAFVYGATGSTNLVDITDFLSQTALADAGLLLAGTALLLVGVGFKVAAVPFHVWTPDGVKGALFYLAAYAAMVAGSFGVVTLVSRKGDIGTSLDDFRGLSRDRPVLALVFALFLVAQAGVPLTAGFVAKLYVVQAAIDAGSTVLAVVAMLTAVIAAFLYLRIIVSMYMTSDDELPEARTIPIPFGAGLALVLSAVVTLGAGLFPSLLSNPADDAVPALVVEADPPPVEVPQLPAP